MDKELDLKMNPERREGGEGQKEILPGGGAELIECIDPKWRWGIEEGAGGRGGGNGGEGAAEGREEGEGRKEILPRGAELIKQKVQKQEEQAN